MVYLKQNSISHIVRVLLFFTVLILLNSCAKEESSRPFFSSNKVIIRPLDGNFISEDRNNNQLFANGRKHDGWDMFYIIYENDSIIKIKSSTGNFLNIPSVDQKDKKASFFILKPHKQYYRILTKEGENVFVDNDLGVKTSLTKRATLFRIKSYFSLPDSLLSLLELNLGRFFFQLITFMVGVFMLFKFFPNLIRENKYSYKSVLVIGFILLFVVFDTKPWKDNKVIVHDVVSYYEYLPAAFIFNDLSFEYVDNLPFDFEGDIWVDDNEETGRRLPKTSMGLSFMYLPFFLTGHLVAKLQNYTAYGYSEPYGKMIVLGCWLYVFIGLFYLRKILLKYFNDVVASLTLFSVVLATNLFYYTTIEPGMSHAYSFCLIILFIWSTMRWYENPKISLAVSLGLLSGLIALIRPTNALIVVFFLLYDIKSLTDIKNKMVFLWKYKHQILLIIIAALLVWLPQMAFWKYATNHWLFFSYGEERFYFNNPHILDGLFSYRKGWLVYTPIMIFALIGILPLYKMQRKFFLPLLVFLPVNIFVMYSWWSWYYGGGFGSRPMVDSYGLLAIPLAAFFTYFNQTPFYLRVIPFILFFLTSSLNLFQTQQTKTCLHWSDMTKESYWTNFTTLGKPEGFEAMLKEPDNENLRKGLDERE
ncbi:MAG: hypothetical protein J5I47_04455 [Vicingus serpentipes]|nr:hypothetical protein [Vicingus serpentipes]